MTLEVAIADADYSDFWVVTASSRVTDCSLDVHGSVHCKRIFKYNQQDATLHNLFISVKCSTRFTRFFRPSSGAQNCTYSIEYFVRPLLLPATVVEELELTVVGSSKGLTKYPMLYVQFLSS